MVVGQGQWRIVASCRHIGWAKYKNYLLWCPAPRVLPVPETCITYLLDLFWPRSKASTSFAAQRFDTIVQILRTVCLRINAVIRFLCEVRATKSDVSAWAGHLLDEARLHNFKCFKCFISHRQRQIVAPASLRSCCSCQTGARCWRMNTWCCVLWSQNGCQSVVAMFTLTTTWPGIVLGKPKLGAAAGLWATRSMLPVLHRPYARIDHVQCFEYRHFCQGVLLSRKVSVMQCRQLLPGLAQNVWLSGCLWPKPNALCVE